MCGIFGYTGHKKNAAEIILEGLKRLEYRGYDSWGIAVKAPQNIRMIKNVGKIGDINKLNLPSSSIAIGHTRWATTGGVTKVNAHPHFSTDKSFVLAHNGIVENHQSLKKDLVATGYKFVSETDTEVIVRLIEDKLKKSNNLLEAVRIAVLELKGRNTIILLNNTEDEIITARNGSPLVLGLGKVDDEIYFSSDTLSFAPHVNKIIVIDNEQLARYKNGEINVIELKTGSRVKYKSENLNIKSDKVDKAGYAHFMLKEINENPEVIKRVINQKKSDLKLLAKTIINARNVYTIGSGTAGIAAAQIAYYLRKYGKIKATNIIGAESQEYYDLFTNEDLIIAPSQSGETADVLEVLEAAKPRGVKIASYVNMPGSAISRMSDIKFLANAGPEICVMSTKIFVSKLAWGYLLSKMVAGKYNEGVKNLEDLADNIRKYLINKNNTRDIKKLANILVNKDDIFLMGKGQTIQIMNEGMVKLIEGTYKHAHSVPAGDLKHYAITLMEAGVPVIVALLNDSVKDDALNSINEVKARGSDIIGISPEPHKLFDYFLKVPETIETGAIACIIPLQLLSYYMAIKLGNDADKPRNIAKSVTVK